MTGIFVYITTGSEDEAREIGAVLVKDRLAACVNILPPVRSITNWQDKIAEGQETVMLVKTRAELFPAVEKKVLELHSYEVPCIVALPISQGYQPFMDWLIEETKP